MTTCVHVQIDWINFQIRLAIWEIDKLFLQFYSMKKKTIICRFLKNVIWKLQLNFKVGFVHLVMGLDHGEFSLNQVEFVLWMD